jgi:NAD(P)-dependent dehydrogenase (short-subunit alcohol dehydrogenase family)
MEKKVCFITGANAGIGKSAAIQIARAGYHVLMGCRNMERGLLALTEIKSKSGSDAIDLVEIDMSSKNSIKKAAEKINNQVKKVDVLIHNAADFDLSRKKPVASPDGIETIWATNHIGPVLLTNLLLDQLKKSEQGRIITVASQGLMLYPALKVDLKDPEYKEKRFSVPKAYYQSKLAQVMYTYWLSDQLKSTRITVNCIRVTNVRVDINRYPDLSPFMKFMYSIKSKFSISPDKMANTYTYLAISGELTKTTGKYFNEKNWVVDSSGYSRDKKNIEDVMDLTFRYIN